MKQFKIIREPVDIIVIVYQLFIIVLMIFNFTKFDNSLKQLTIHCLVIGFIFLVRYYPKQNLFSLFLNVWLPYLCIPINFSQLPELIPALRPSDLDQILIQIDFALFGVHPTVWLEKLYNPFVAEILVYIYVSFYFLPIILIHRLNHQGKLEEVVFFKFVFFTGFYLSYIGYFLVPAIGPRFTLDHLQSFSIYGIFIAEMIQSTLNTLEQVNRDAFPSGHTMMTVLCLIYAWKYDRPLGKVYIPITIGMLISTVYLRYHYVIDLIAGFVFLGILFLFVKPLFRFISSRLKNQWYINSHRATDILQDSNQQ